MIPNLSKGMIDDMQQLRKRMRSEFGVELRLSQADIIERITELAQRSKDQRTRTLFEHLTSQMGGELKVPQNEPAEEVPAPRQRIKVYRGQTIIEEIQPDIHTAKKERIYRGQVVA